MDAKKNQKISHRINNLYLYSKMPKYQVMIMKGVGGGRGNTKHACTHCVIISELNYMKRSYD